VEMREVPWIASVLVGVTSVALLVSAFAIYKIGPGWALLMMLISLVPALLGVYLTVAHWNLDVAQLKKQSEEDRKREAIIDLAKAALTAAAQVGYATPESLSTAMVRLINGAATETQSQLESAGGQNAAAKAGNR
jgi:hypothetical protein